MNSTNKMIHKIKEIMSQSENWEELYQQIAAYSAISIILTDIEREYGSRSNQIDQIRYKIKSLFNIVPDHRSDNELRGEINSSLDLLDSRASDPDK